MTKKFTQQLTDLTTPDIRSVLRWLNNNVEKHVKPTLLASMKHDKALAVIEDKYKPADIEKALDNLASGTLGNKREAAAPTTTTTHTKPHTNGKFASAMQELHTLADELDKCIKNLKNTSGMSGASYIIEVGGNFFVIGASANGACLMDNTIFTTAEAAHKHWPEAILPAPLATAEDLGDLL
jgi:hypothetical protein